MKKFLLWGSLALVALAASCSKNDETPSDGKPATLTVSIAGQSRAVIEPGEQPARELLEKENIVNSFTAFVFNSSNGRLEAKASPAGNALTVTIPNLNTATPKKVVVVVNAVVDIAVGGNYSEFVNEVNFIDLDSQEYGKVAAGEGMAMYGEESVALVEGTNSRTIPVSRLASKVAIESVTVTPDPQYGYTDTDLQNFKLTGVSMQKVVGVAGFHGTNTGVLYGGITGGDNASTQQRDYLKDDFDASLQDFTHGQTRDYGNFFYVLPNEGVVDGGDTHYTLLSLVGQYYDQTVYFPVVVKDNGDQAVKNNTTYTVKLNIKDLQGSPGPEVPKGEATLDVTVEVEDWTVAPTQNEEW